MSRGSAAHHIVPIVAAIASAIIVVGYFGFSLYYDALFYFWPALFEIESEAAWLWLTWGALAILMVIVLPVVGLFGWWMAHRLVSPLLDVASAVRAVAQGDLSARASGTQKRFGEAASLIDDFNRMAERLERSQDNLRYQNSAIAHELRTPLTILKGRLQGISDGVFPVTPELLDLLIEQVDGLTRIVEDLSTVSLFGTGGIAISPVPTDISGLVEDVAELLKAEFSAASMLVSLDLAPSALVADPTRLRQAIIALSTNAIRYAPGTRLELATGARDGMVFFSCTDNGPGLSDLGLRRAFEPFWRAEDSRSRDQGGAGLGLAVVKAIAEAHGGQVSAQNTAHGGARFELLLPRG